MTETVSIGAHRIQKRKLGSTGLEVSEIGFGAWGIGGYTPGLPAYGETDDRVSEDALKAAYDRGVTFYDTSDLYGLGHSEELIGKSLKSVRSHVCFATKSGFLKDGSQDFTPQHIRSALERSLRRLGTDYVDLYQLHSPPVDSSGSVLELIKTLSDLQQEGKTRAFGISARSPDDGLAAARMGFPSIQVNFNMTDQRAVENGLFDFALENNVGIIARSPLCYGFLTGQYSERDHFGADDYRSTWPKEQLRLWAQAGKLFFDSLHTQQTPAQAAIRFCLSFPAVTTVIPGMLNAAHVQENTISSAPGPFSKEDLARIQQIHKTHTFFIRK